MTKEERLRSEDMGGYYRVAADSRDLNYDKFFVNAKGLTYTWLLGKNHRHNTIRLVLKDFMKSARNYVRNN